MFKPKHKTTPARVTRHAFGTLIKQTATPGFTCWTLDHALYPGSRPGTEPLSGRASRCGETLWYEFFLSCGIPQAWAERYVADLHLHLCPILVNMCSDSYERSMGVPRTRKGRQANADEIHALRLRFADWLLAGEDTVIE